MQYVLPILGLITAVSIFGARMPLKDRSNQYFKWQDVLAEPVAWVSSILFVVVGVFYPFTYAVSTNSNAALRAYSEIGRSAYVKTATMAQLIKPGRSVAATLPTGAVAFDPSLWEHNKTVSKRWAELRNKDVWFNTLLHKKRECDRNWFLRLWVASPPADLLPIEFSKEE